MRRFSSPHPLMTAILACVAGVALVHASQQAPAQAPVFRASTDAIWVTATAIDAEGRLILDLDRDEFEVLDDGVAQSISIFRSDDVPFALAVMFDLSGSLAGREGLMHRAMLELIGQFRPGDRAIVGAFDTLPAIGDRFSSHATTLLKASAAAISGVLRPCSGPWMADLIRRPRARGYSGVWDAVACGIDAVASDAETPRRIVLVITDGLDNVSLTRQPEVQALADMYGVMVYVVAMVGETGLDTGGLKSLAVETGGGYFVLNQDAELAPTFARVADELRHQYVLGYTAGDGPHGRVEVRVRRPGITARGRRATMTDLPVAPAVTEAVAAERARRPDNATRLEVVVRDNDTVFDRSVRGELNASNLPRLALQPLKKAISDIRQNGLPWVLAAGPDHESDRRLQLATFILEFLSVQDDAVLWTRGQPADELFNWAAEALRVGPVRPEELAWHLAGIALLERFGAADALERHLDRAEQRFPGEPRFALARAVAAELRTWPQRRDGHDFEVNPVDLAKVTRRYYEAFQVDAVREEAYVRFGFFELRRGRAGEALKHFGAAGSPDDAWVRYTLGLFRGQALAQEGRYDDAIASFEGALKVMPYAQAATLALGAALVARSDRADAERVVNRMLAVQPAPDPWTTYLVPAWRDWARWIDALRRVGQS